ncbi:MAG: hypothetical protein ACJ786_05025 [Catenulispora sp.]
MADHIKIDIQLLSDMGTQLGTLRDEFNNSTQIVDGFGGDMGSGDVAGALHDFASDWDTKRKDLIGSLDKLAQGAAGAAKTWDGVDKHLATALEKAMSGDGEKK